VAPARPVKLEEVKFAAALFGAAALALPGPAAATPLICIDPGHDATPDLSRERIGPGSTTYKIKDGGGAPGEATVVLQIGSQPIHVIATGRFRAPRDQPSWDVSLIRVRRHPLPEGLASRDPSFVK